MTGGALLGLIMLSMAWLYFLIGVIRPGMGFVPGLVGSLAVFFTIPALARYDVEVPGPGCGSCCRWSSSLRLSGGGDSAPDESLFLRRILDLVGKQEVELG